MCEKESFVEIDDIENNTRKESLFKKSLLKIGNGGQYRASRAYPRVLKIVRNFLKTKEKKQFTNKNNVRS